MEFNKLIASVLVAGLVFVAINVGVDEVLHKSALEMTVYPVPAMAAATEQALSEGAGAEDVAGPSVLALIGAADMDAGKKLLKRCASCHDLAQGGPNKIGPNLWGIVDSTIASREGYSYSAGLAAVGGDWSYEALDAFLTKPKAFAPGTKMIFAGFKKPADRANIIGFLRMLSENPAPLPGE